MSTKKLSPDINISGRVKTVRVLQRMSQVDFARSLGIKQPTLSEIEKGTYPPSESVKRLIVSQYRIREEWLEAGSGTMSEFEVRDQGVSYSASREKPKSAKRITIEQLLDDLDGEDKDKLEELYLFELMKLRRGIKGGN
jgi:transcriptional regulator with XRE-family HTH domain